MKTVSAVRLRLGKKTVEQVRAFCESLRKNIEVVNLRVPFPECKEKQILLVGIFSDRGLVGGFNRNIADFVLRFIESRDKSRVKVVVVGKQGEKELRQSVSQDILFVSPLPIHQVPHYADLRDLAYRILKIKEKEECTHLYIAFTRYFSITNRIPTVIQIFPPHLDTKRLRVLELEKLGKSYLFLGDVLSLRNFLEQQYFLGMFYQAVVESFVSEQAARFTIMDAATIHSKEVIESLSVAYHKRRQERITQELNEVTGAVEVLKFFLRE
ncbi:MAG: F0F1 ATP synthase subunit gamma, partial [Candidatus Caldatribacteriaceae bacterium]